MSDKNRHGRSRLSWRTVLIILVIFLLYAYGLQVTKVDLQEPLEPRRQENLVSLLRDLAQPDFFSHDTETRNTAVSIHMPCPGEIKGTQVTIEGREALMVPNCATTTQDRIRISGEGFQPNADGVLAWRPIGATTSRRLADFKVSPDGQIDVTFTMPDIRPTEEAQKIEIVEILSRRITGLSDTTMEALDKIVETVLMALMASTIGTILAIPLSFFAASNLMRDVKAPLAGIMAGVILAPIMGGLGWWAANSAAQPLLGLIGQNLQFLRTDLGFFNFIGNFIFVLLEMMMQLLPLAIALIGALLAVSLGGRFGQQAAMHMAEAPARILTFALTIGGTAVLFIIIAYSLNWINLFGIREFLPEATAAQIKLFAIPGLVLGGIAGLLSLRASPKYHYAIGILIYTLTRGVFNGVRSIEPLMMGFVFVIWVGLGPFAGIMALTLHSMADLGKLFSEQVENINQGPVEAVTATGANFTQSIVYAVVPQITPHYIAYIFYRWDINVRMSTIIGFVGGGGIGFVLNRTINLTAYSQASVMIIAIAVVVTILDNISARIRSRII